MNLLATLCNGSLLPDFAAPVGSSAGFRDNVLWFVDTYPLVAFYVAIVLLLVILLLLLRSRRARRDVRVYQNDGGFAVVSQKALRHLIYIACDDAGLASSPKISFREVKGRINVQIGLKLFQSQRLSDVHELLRQRIRTAVEETHGIQVGDVSVKILGFRKDAHHHEAREEAQEQTVAERPAPGEASAASLYEEPITSDTLAEDSTVEGGEAGTQSAGDGTEQRDSTAAGEPKKRRFGFFGRKKEVAGDSLFVSEDLDAAADAERAPDAAADNVSPSADEVADKPSQDGGENQPRYR